MEKLRKVNSFSELKIGQIVVVVNCRQCNKAKCRKMLTKIEINAKVDPSNPHYENAWYGLPKCNLKPLYLLAVAETTVAEGRVYLVEDGLEDSKTEKEKINKKLVKAL